MRLEPIAIALIAALALATPFAGPVAHAQDGAAEMPPLPRPRPDFLPATPAPQTDPAAETQSGAAPEAGAVGAIEALTSAPQPVTLTALIASGGAAIDGGLVWRVFDTTPDANGQLALVSRSENAVVSLNLIPGEYVVHVAYGRAQTSDTVTVREGASNAVSIVLEAGALRLGGAVSGDIPIPANLLRFDIQTAGPEAARTTLVEGLRANEIVTLNTGTYHVVSHFGAINAVVRADLRVEPGQLTDATLYHQASQISFKLVSETGGEAIADVDWSVIGPEGEVLFAEVGAFPATVLSAGDYTVLARRGQTVFNRDFSVQPGSPREIEVLTTVY